jgi:acetate---CoA ligase (ADP-forming)
MPSPLARALFAPNSVALIGASSDPEKASSRPLRFLQDSHYGGQVYPINPRVTQPGWYGSVSDLPSVPDHAYVMTPTERTVLAVEQCAELGVPMVTVMSGGFAESGPDGAQRQRELAAIATMSATRILGPSSLGVVNLRNGLRLTANAAFAELDMPTGGTFVASHSGSMIGSIVSRGAARGLGFASLVSVGGEVDLSLGEVCGLALEDPEVAGYLVFLESLRNAEDLGTFARAASAAGKPVVAYKVGRSPAAAELAVSHTGAIASEDDVAEAFFEDCGISRVHTLDGLVESLTLLASTGQHPDPAKLRGVGVLTTTGGGAAMVVDQLGLRGVDVRPPSASTLERLALAGISVESGRIVDLTLAGTRADAMRAALEILSSAPEFDLLVVVVGSSARLHPQIAVEPIVEVFRTRPTGIAVFLVPEAGHALAMLAACGVPAFRTPESCADVVAAALSRRDAKPRPEGRRRVSACATELLDERASYDVLASVGVPVPAFEVREVGQSGFGGKQVAYPVVVKALSAALLHKSDAGCVRLGLADDSEVDRAISDVAQRYELHTGQRLDRVLLVSQESGLAEVLVGFRRDAEVGPIVLVAPGGTEAELRGERALRLAPVDRATAESMLAELPSLEILRGYRNHPRGDLGALADVVVAMSSLAASAEIREAEANPVLVRADGEGCVAIDAVVIRASAEVGEPAAPPVVHS